LKIYAVNFSEDQREDKKRELSAKDCLNIIEKINSRDHDIMGFNFERSRLTNLIIQTLPVAPPPVRPSVAVDGGVIRSEDDLSFQ